MSSYGMSIILFAGNYEIEKWLFCNGQGVSSSDYSFLSYALGNTYGIDDNGNFLLPDLAVPSSGLVSEDSGYMNYLISTYNTSTDDLFDDSYTGQVMLWSGFKVPSGWELCNGQQLDYNTYDELAEIIQDAYGAIDGTLITLPDMTSPVTGMNYIICTSGIWPTSS